MLQCLAPQMLTDSVIFTAMIGVGILGIYVWLRRQNTFFGKDRFQLSLLAMAVWLLGCLMEMSQVTLDCRVFWASASWAMIVLLPTAWSMFLLEYCVPALAHRHQRLKRRLLIGGPLVALMIVGTNPWHQLFYGPETRMVVDAGGRLTAVFDHGPLFYLLAAYLYFFLGYATWQSFRGVLHAQERFRLFFFGLFMITIVPALANLSYIALGWTVFGFDPTPFAFSAVLVILTWMVANNRVMDLASVAQHVLFHAMTDAVLVLGPDGRVVEANPAARRLIGQDLPRGGLSAETLPWMDEILDVTAQANADAVPPPMMIRVDNRDFSVSLAPVPRPIKQDHDLMGWAVRLHDLTSHRRLEEALNVQRNALASVMEISLSGIIALDPDGVIVLMSGEAERITGTNLSDAVPLRIGDPAWDIRTPQGDRIENLAEMMALFLQSDRPIWDQRLSFIRQSDQERRILSLNATPMRADRQSRARIALSIADVTERYMAETALREAALRAEAANRAKSQFLANMSHEIRTPLNGVLGMADVLAGRLQQPDHRRMAEAIRDSGELLLSLLNDILDMAKIEAGKIALEHARVQPGSIAERIHALFRQQAAGKGLDFSVLLGTGAAAPRIGDAFRIQQILQNLVSNAIKFTTEGEVRVELSTDASGALVLEVADTGIGMSQDQVARIFEEFEQADGTTTRRFGGTGLGMSIVRRLAELMGGHVIVESEAGFGTTVRATLPLPRAED